VPLIESRFAKATISCRTLSRFIFENASSVPNPRGGRACRIDRFRTICRSSTWSNCRGFPLHPCFTPDLIDAKLRRPNREIEALTIHQIAGCRIEAIPPQSLGKRSLDCVPVSFRAIPIQNSAAISFAGPPSGLVVGAVTESGDQRAGVGVNQPRTRLTPFRPVEHCRCHLMSWHRADRLSVLDAAGFDRGRE
jgi:hypothetical protein